MDPSQSPKDTKIKLYIDAMTTRQQQVFSAAIFLILGLIFIIASGVPDEYATEFRSRTSCISDVYSPLGYTCSDFNMASNPVVSFRVNGVTTSHKFLGVYLAPERLRTAGDASLPQSTKIEVSAYIMNGDKPDTKYYEKQVMDLNIECSSDLNEPCKPQRAISINSIVSGDYYFVIKFLENNKLSGATYDLAIMTTTYSLSFRNYMFITKLLFLALTITGFFFMIGKLNGLKKAFFTPEQKLLQFIAPILITINEPFSRHITGGTLYTWFTTANFVVFSTIIIYFWLNIMYDLAGSESSVFERSSLFVKLYTLVYFIISLSAFVVLADDMLKDPLYEFDSVGSGKYGLLRAALYLVLAVGIGWMAYKTYNIVLRMHDLEERQSTFFWFSIFFIVCHFYLIFRGSLDPFASDGKGMLLFAGTSTLYIFASGYLFLPTQEGINQANYILKYANPEVKDSYKDLEASVQHPPAQADKGHPMGDYGQAGVPASLDRMGNTDGEQKYPYEHRGDDDM